MSNHNWFNSPNSNTLSNQSIVFSNCADVNFRLFIICVAITKPAAHEHVHAHVYVVFLHHSHANTHMHIAQSH